MVATALLRLIAASSVGLGFGESYYFSAARHPDLSYFDHPPLSLLIGTLSLELAGAGGPLILRLPFILLFAGTTWLLFAIGRRLYGAWSGFFAALLLNTSAVFTASVAAFFQPDGPLIFFWLAAAACLVRLYFPPAPPRPLLLWAGAGAALGLAMLSKYHALFLIFGAGMVAITGPEQRRWLRHPGPYLALCIVLVSFLPVLLWNHQHGWISFLWQGGRGVASDGLRFDWLARSIGGQALWVLPWIWAPLIRQLPLGFRGGPRNGAGWFVSWLAVAPIVVFTAAAAYAPLGYHFHWQAPGYILLFLPLGDLLRRRLAEGSRAWRRWLHGSLVFTAAALLLLITHAASGWLWRLVPERWADQERAYDPTLESLDYTPLRGALEERGLLGLKELFVFTPRWFLSGKVDWALGGRMAVLCLHPADPRGFAFWAPPERWRGKDGILVSVPRYLADPRSFYAASFERIIPLGEVEVRRGGRVELVLQLWRCHGLKSFPVPYR
jgi:hypothetical protein